MAAAATTSARPTILLLAGAFGTPSCFDRLLPHFEQAGYPTLPAPYPSSYPADPPGVSCQADIAHVRDAILRPAIEDRHQHVLVLAHSYGGIVAGAAKGLDAASRQAQGQPGGVVGFVYIAGNITLENESLLEAVGGGYPPFIHRDTVFSTIAPQQNGWRQF